jgi:UDP-glucuronate 4-epimerase
MAMFLFTRAILEGRPIEVFNHGHMLRDFTYVDDLVEGVARVLDRVPQPDPAWSGDRPNPASSTAPYRLYNIGNTKPVALLDMIAVLEQALGREAQKVFRGLQPGDVPETYADVEELAAAVDYRPSTPIEVGIPRFVEWYRGYYGV